MSDADILQQIEKAINAFAGHSLKTSANGLFDVLGYRSKRQIDIAPNTAAGFKAMFAPSAAFRDDRALATEWRSVDMLFQYTGDELREGLQGQAGLGFDVSEDLNEGRSYLFFAIDLAKRDKPYNRTELAEATREVNKLFLMPAMVLFKTGDTFSIAVIDRRLNKRDTSKDVLEKVTLIKDIRIASPHRAHLEILKDLSLAELAGEHDLQDFEALHNAWRKTLDSSTLNKRFYQDVANWFFWASQKVTFPIPEDKPTRKQVEEHTANSLIRLITRLIFVWFIKEKGLVPDDLFNPNRLKALLKEGDKLEKSSKTIYYKAILQNLFFGTLNTEMDTGRGFRSKSKQASGRDGNYMVHNLYRYEDLFSDPAASLNLFSGIPFLNGGLFECLDYDEETEKGKPVTRRIDGFSDNPKNPLDVPDFLFFGGEREVNLNDDFGTSNKRYKARGLVEVFKRYKFTIEENTPIEEEVALDPELLGKVFENLLAAYNPETGTTARKQTGSFYTPREIVNYMVDESLIAYFEGKLAAITEGEAVLDETAPEAMPDLFGNAPPVQSQLVSNHRELSEAQRNGINERLHHLLAYNNEEQKFNSREVDVLIDAIDEVDILDPACGSGAFPMGVLHKLVFILGKLDPDNKGWKERQRRRAIADTEEAYKLDGKEERERRLQDINDAFEHNSSDYGRKLYLIENCIFGVDIQPIAVQIAKLRFFISLVVDQKVDAKRDNLGIRPLPNLETKFVAANTLISIPRPQQIALRNPAIDEKEEALKRVRHEHFAARTPATKRKYRKEDAKLRAEIAELLKKDGWDGGTAAMLAGWDPYNQNAHAPFFDPEWMFGMTDGFDIVIGNPPYVRADVNEEYLTVRRMIEDSEQYETLWEKWDLFIPFIERGYKLLVTDGVITLIVSDAYCHSKYAQKSQAWFLSNSAIRRLDFLSNLKIFDAVVRNIIFFYQRSNGNKNIPERRVHQNEFGNVLLLKSATQSQLTHRVFFPEDTVADEVRASTLRLDEIMYISKGIVAHANEKKAPGAFVLDDLLSYEKDLKHPKPYVEGKDLDRWVVTTNKYIEWGTRRSPRLLSRPTFEALYAVREKLISVDMSAGYSKLRVVYDDQQLLHNHSAWSFVPWHYLRGVRNTSLKKVARYNNEMPFRADLPKREVLEVNSEQFDVKFVLACMNSSFARDYLRANRRSNLHLYPDDWKQLPIPKVSREAQNPIVALINSILKEKRKDAQVDVSALEMSLDQLIYKLYGVDEKSLSVGQVKQP